MIKDNRAPCIAQRQRLVRGRTTTLLLLIIRMVPNKIKHFVMLKLVKYDKNKLGTILVIKENRVFALPASNVFSM